MTHFIGAVVIPENFGTRDLATAPTQWPDLYGADHREWLASKDLGAYLDKALEKFNENREVDRYVEYTREQIIAKGREEIRTYAENTYAKYQKDPAAYEKSHPNVPQHTDYLRETFPKKLAWTDEEVYKDQTGWYEPEDIGADGEVYSSRNPHSQWDWWTVGGRWQKIYADKQAEPVGLFIERLEQKLKDMADPDAIAEVNAATALIEKLEEQSKEARAGLSSTEDQKAVVESWRSFHEKIEKVREKRADMRGYAPWWTPWNIVIPSPQAVESADSGVDYEQVEDWTWIEKGKMGWWGMSSDEDDTETWLTTLIDVLKGLNPSDRIIYIDFHI